MKKVFILSRILPTLIISILLSVSVHANPEYNTKKKPPEYNTKKKPRIVVLDFKNANEIAKKRKYGETVSAMIGTALADNANVILVENEDIRQQLQKESMEGTEGETDLSSKLGERVDVVVHGTVSLICEGEEIANNSDKEKGPWQACREDPQTEVDMRIASIRTNEVLSAKHFKVEAIKELRARVIENIDDVIETFLKPYSGRVKFTLEGYRDLDNQDPRKVRYTFYDDESLPLFSSDITLKFRPMSKSIINANGVRKHVDTTDEDYKLITSHFFAKKADGSDREESPDQLSIEIKNDNKLSSKKEESMDKELSIPLVTGEYKFELELAGYHITSEIVEIYPRQKRPISFAVDLKRASLEIITGESRPDTNMILLIGKDTWNGKPIPCYHKLPPYEQMIYDKYCNANEEDFICKAMFPEKDENTKKDRECTAEQIMLVWKPENRDHHTDWWDAKDYPSGYGYLKRKDDKAVSSQKTGDNYIIKNLPVGQYDMYTIPEPVITTGRVKIDAFLTKESISVEEEFLDKSNEPISLGRKNDKQSGEATIFLDPYYKGKKYIGKSILYIKNKSMPEWVVLGEIDRYGEIYLKGLEAGTKYTVRIRYQYDSFRGLQYSDDIIKINPEDNKPLQLISKLLPRRRQRAASAKTRSSRLTYVAPDNEQWIKNYINTIKTGSSQDWIKVSKKLLKNRELLHSKILNAIAIVLKKSYRSPRVADVDALAWFCRVLGKSGDKKYVSVLSDVAQKSTNNKLRSYARHALGQIT